MPNPGGRPANAAGLAGGATQPINSPMLSDLDRSTTSQARERGGMVDRMTSRMSSQKKIQIYSNFADFSRYSSGLWSSSSARSQNLATPLRPQSDDFSLSASFPSANNKVHPVPIAVAATPSDFGANSSRYTYFSYPF